MKRQVVLFAAAALFLTAFAASAQTGTWTAVGSTGTVDPASPLWGVFGGTRLGFSASGGSSAGTIVSRFNVTNTYGGFDDDSPPWTTLEVGAVNTSVFDTVTGRLYRVDPCSGTRTLICTATNSSASSSGACTSCTFSNTTFNFGNFLYYVEVSITRTTGTGTPQHATLRIF